MLGDEDIVFILGRELLAGVKTHAQRRYVRTDLHDRLVEFVAGTATAEIRIEQVALVAERIAIVGALLRQAVQRVVRQFVIDPVAAIVGEPQFLGHGVKIHADAVAHAMRYRLQDIGLHVQPHDGGVGHRWRRDVGWRADLEVQVIAVRAQAHEFPAVRFILGQGVEHHHRCRRIVEIGFDIVVAADLRQFGDIQRAILEDHAVRPVQTLGNYLDFAFAILVDHRIHVAGETRADIQHPSRRQRHRTGIRHAGGIQLDLESRRRLQAGGRNIGCRQCGQPGRMRHQGRLCLFGSAALRPGGGNRRRCRRCCRCCGRCGRCGRRCRRHGGRRCHGCGCEHGCRRLLGKCSADTGKACHESNHGVQAHPALLDIFLHAVSGTFIVLTHRDRNRKPYAGRGQSMQAETGDICYAAGTTRKRWHGRHCATLDTETPDTGVPGNGA